MGPGRPRRVRPGSRPGSGAGSARTPRRSREAAWPRWGTRPGSGSGRSRRRSGSTGGSTTALTTASKAPSGSGKPALRPAGTAARAVPALTEADPRRRFPREVPSRCRRSASRDRSRRRRSRCGGSAGQPGGCRPDSRLPQRRTSRRRTQRDRPLPRGARRFREISAPAGRRRAPVAARRRGQARPAGTPLEDGTDFPILDSPGPAGRRFVAPAVRYDAPLPPSDPAARFNCS